MAIKEKSGRTEVQLHWDQQNGLIFKSNQVHMKTEGSKAALKWIFSLPKRKVKHRPLVIPGGTHMWAPRLPT